MSKKIIIIAGPHGAGKTVFAQTFLPAEAACPCFIDAHLIAAGLSPFAPEMAYPRARRLMQEEIHACVERGRSFAFETTLFDPGYAHIIPKWRKAGYRVNLYFLNLSSVDVAIARVAERVRQGGHDVPQEVVRRHYVAGLHNFRTRYRESADAWVMYDNSVEQPCFQEFGENSTPFIKESWSMAAWRYRFAERPHAPSWRSRTHTDLAVSDDSDLRGSYPALLRAAERARQIAIQTHTSLIVGRKHGKFVHLAASRLRA